MKTKSSDVIVVLTAASVVIGAVALYVDWQRKKRDQLPPPQFYNGLRGLTNPFTGQYMSAQQVTEMEWQ